MFEWAKFRGFILAIIWQNEATTSAADLGDKDHESDS